MTIPTEVEDLTPAWFSEVLDADISAVDVLDAHTGTTGRARVRVTTQADIPETLFVKLQPFPQEQRELVRMVGMGVAEARLYAAVGDELPVRIPRVWHASFDESDGSFIMVLEDLEASGCRFASAEDDDVLTVVESLMDELAALHAHYWGQELPWLGTTAMSEDAPDAAEKVKMGAAFVQMALDQFTDELPTEFRRLGELYIARPIDVRDEYSKGERTLIHGDSHIGNLFVDGGRTGFYDWAIVCRFPGMRDVAYTLCNSLPTEVRRSEEDRLVARYRAGLAKRGVELDAAEAHDQYRLCSIYSWIGATTTAAMGSKWQPADVGWRATQRTTQAIVDLDVLGLLAERGVS